MLETGGVGEADPGKKWLVKRLRNEEPEPLLLLMLLKEEVPSLTTGSNLSFLPIGGVIVLLLVLLELLILLLLVELVGLELLFREANILAPNRGDPTGE